MSRDCPNGDWQSDPLFHVGDRAIPPGEALRPYAIARECADVIRLADRALDRGADAVRRFLSGEAWERPWGRGGCRPEMVLLEALFERERRLVTPHSPSRLDAVYAWRSLDLARRFRDEYRPDGVVWRCALVAGTASERDAALVVEAYETANLGRPTAQDLRRVAERAARYWQAQAPMALPEVLVHGTVAAEAIVDPGADHGSGSGEARSGSGRRVGTDDCARSSLR